MNYNNLLFYDSDSNELNLEIVDGIWQGVVYLPEVSAGLYETLTLYILEETRTQLGEEKYVMPIANSNEDVSFEFEFESKYGESNDIFIYDASINNGELYINKKDKQNKLINHSNNINYQDSFKLVDTKTKQEPLMVNVALNSEVDNFHIRTLNIYEVTKTNRNKIAAIKIYGEVEAEDERLKVLLRNIGIALESDDFYIFKSSDIKEGAPNFKILNEKRKELLLQASEIKPFIGTYKALLNAIDFFGYDKLTLKEYWLNINSQAENFGKLSAIAVSDQKELGFLANKNKKVALPNSNQKKTSRFSLVYRINVPNNTFDEWDVPKVKETFDFSPDEVLIKLYGLKNKIQKEYLPLNAKIVDITGEADYFSQFNQNIWNNQQSIKNQSAGVEFDFELIPNNRNIFVEDLRKIDYNLTGFNQDFNNLSNKNDVADNIINFYDNYYNKDLDSFNTLESIAIGAPIVLNITGLGDTWNDAKFTWMDANDTGDTLLNWDEWWHRNVYEIEWVIKGPRNYLKKFRGPITEYKKFPLTLPYTGKYTVDTHLYDLFNVKSTKTKKDFIEVKNKEVEIYGLTQLATKKLNWNQYNYTWNKAGSTWKWGRENNLSVADNIATLYLTLDRANYINDDSKGIEFSTVRRFKDSNQESGFNETTGPYQWQSLSQKWEDGPQVNWDMTRIGSDINSSFKIKLVNDNQQNSGTIKMIKKNYTNTTIIDEYQIRNAYPRDNKSLSAWNAIANELNNLTAKNNPLLSNFNYNAILEDNINSGVGLGEDTCNYILAVANQPSRNYDFDQVELDIGTIDNIIHFTSYNPDYNDVFVFNSQATLHLLNHITFAYDLTNMPGIKRQRWKLTNNSLKTEDIYYNNKRLTYLFKDKGNYSIELELVDSNNNINKINKNILKII